MSSKWPRPNSWIVAEAGPVFRILPWMLWTSPCLFCIKPPKQGPADVRQKWGPGKPLRFRGDWICIVMM